MNRIVERGIIIKKSEPERFSSFPFLLLSVLGSFIKQDLYSFGLLLSFAGMFWQKNVVAKRVSQP